MFRARAPTLALPIRPNTARTRTPIPSTEKRFTALAKVVNKRIGLFPAMRIIPHPQLLIPLGPQAQGVRGSRLTPCVSHPQSFAMAATMQLQRASAAFAAKPRTSRSSALRRMVVRAEDTKLAKVERVAKSGGAVYVNVTDSASLSYLDGSRPGDFGFDPLGLLDPTTGSGGFISPEWLTYSEVIHCRYAMLGAAGCLAPEVLQHAGVIPSTPEEATWFLNGAFPFLGQYEKGYWADPYTLFWVEVILMQFAELRRWQDFKKPGSMGEQYFLGLETIFKGSGNPSYPGGQFFNAFNLGKTEAETFKLRTNEIRNGRLAMLAMLGFGAQAVLTGKGPFQNLLDHLADPTGANILTNFAHVYGQ